MISRILDRIHKARDNGDKAIYITGKEMDQLIDDVQGLVVAPNIIISNGVITSFFGLAVCEEDDRYRVAV